MGDNLGLQNSLPSSRYAKTCKHTHTSEIIDSYTVVVKLILDKWRVCNLHPPLAWTGQKLLKKMPEKKEHIFGTFEHSWAGLAWNFFYSCSASRWRCNYFCSKLEFLAENFWGRSICAKNHFYRCGKPFFAQKMLRRAKNSNSKIILMSWKRLKMTFKINWIHY